METVNVMPVEFSANSKMAGEQLNLVMGKFSQMLIILHSLLLYFFGYLILEMHHYFILIRLTISLVLVYIYSS